MRIIYKNIYFNNNECKPLLEFIYDSESTENIFKNLKYIYFNSSEPEQKSYFVNFSYGFFDSLSAKSLIKLDKIVNKTYLNKTLWNKYLKDLYDSPEYNKVFHTLMTIPTPTTICNKNVKANENWKPKFIMSKDYETEQLYLSSEYLANDSYKVNAYELMGKNEVDFLYQFLNTIFNSGYHLVIKKCAKCQKYFIATNKKYIRCNRVGSNGLTCAEYETKINKQHSTIKGIGKLKSRIRSNLKHDDELLSKFLEEDKIKKTALYKNDKEYILWLLTYFKTEKAQKRNIKELDLSKYL